MTAKTRDAFRLFPERRPAELALYALFLVAWLASTTGLRDALHAAGVPLLVAGSLPSFLAALASTFLIGGTQGTSAPVSGTLSGVVIATAELPPLLGLTSGVADPRDVLAAALGGAVGAVLLGALRAASRALDREPARS